MPIHPQMKDLYPADWAELSRRIRLAADEELTLAGLAEQAE